MAKRKTNEQLMANLMNYSEFGAVAQMFIINAVLSAAEATAVMDPKTLPDNGMVAPEAWVGVAKEIEQKIKANWA